MSYIVILMSFTAIFPSIGYGYTEPLKAMYIYEKWTPFRTATGRHEMRMYTAQHFGAKFVYELNQGMKCWQRRFRLIFHESLVDTEEPLFGIE
jgi:hypothetical protein